MMQDDCFRTKKLKEESARLERINIHLRKKIEEVIRILAENE